MYYKLLDLQQIENRISNEIVLENNLSLLVENCINEKTFSFKSIHEKIDTKLLSDENIIDLKSKKINLDDNWFFPFYFFKKYAEKQQFKLTYNFQETVCFLKKVDKKYNESKYVPNFETLKRKLWGIAIMKTNTEFNTDFSGYIADLNKETNEEELFSFNAGFALVLPSINIRQETIYKNTNTLFLKIRSDAIYDFNISHLINGIKNRTYFEPKSGINLLDFSLEQDEINEHIVIPVISGVYDKNELNYFESWIESYIKNEELISPILLGLSRVMKIDSKDAKYFLTLCERFIKNEKFKFQVAQLLFAILRKTPYDKVIQDSCFKHLSELLQQNNINLSTYILDEIKYHTGGDDEKTELVIDFIKNTSLQLEKLVRVIDEIFFNLKSIESYRAILFELGKRVPLISISQNLHTSIHEFLNSNKCGFDKILIDLLIDNKASLRFLGIDIFNSLTLRSSYKFKYNILELEPIEQYKLLVSLLGSYREPKYVVPALLPLINSDSKIIQEALVGKLEEYCENYGGILVETLRENLDLKESHASCIYDRINHCNTLFAQKYINVKRELKELNPYYIHNKLFREYSIAYNRKMGSQLDKGSDKQLFLSSFFSNVKLAKSGGWKNEHNDKITELGKFGFSFVLPRCYYIEPEKFDFLRMLEMMEDWDNSFDDVKNALDNE